MNWDDKVVLITGASEGIGASCARLIAARGAKVSLTALPSASFHDVESDSKIVTAGDIRSPRTRMAVVERTLTAFGRIDVLVNNAGIGQYGYPSEVDTEISK
jgi:NAD(P)-dependent dehydrogenase (short-subunit alcohol dehydrogenase family)